MAIQPDTTTGTITLTSGSTTFTTSGTNMITRGHLPGDTILRNGLVLVIETITGQNSGTLRDACPAGAAGSGVPVRIRFQPDGSRVKAEARNLIDILGNGNLQAFSGLTLAPNNLIKATGAGALEAFDGANLISEAAIDGTGGNWLSYYTGAGTKARTALTAFARTLLDDANAATARGTLDVAQKQASAYDETPARALLMGAFGLGSTSHALSGTDNLNNLPDINAFYNWGNDAPTNAPGPQGQLITTARSGSNGGQLCLLSASGANPRLYYRAKGAGVWGSFTEIVTNHNIVVGSNANGSFIRFPNGFQICMATNRVVSQTFSDRFDGLWTFPAAFSSAPFVLPGSLENTPSSNGNVRLQVSYVGVLAPAGTTSVTLMIRFITGAGFSPGDSATISYAVAMGWATP